MTDGVANSNHADGPRGDFKAQLFGAWRCLREGHYEAAAARFVVLQTRYPHSADVTQGLAWSRLLQGHVEEGRVLMVKVVGAEVPHFWEMVRVLSDEVQQAQREGRANPPGTVGEALILSHAALRDHNPEEALRLTRKAAKWLPDNGFIEANIATALALSGKDEQAITSLHRVIHTFETPAMWHNIGLCEFRLGNLANARKAFGKALEILPDYDTSLQALASVEWRERHFLAALKYGWAAFAARRQMREAAKEQPV